MRFIDTLPRRIMPPKQPVSTSKEELDRMLDEYYRARGWNLEEGAPTEKKLRELRLK